MHLPGPANCRGSLSIHEGDSCEGNIGENINSMQSLFKSRERLQNFALVPRDKPVVVICGSGYRGSIAASFLQREGYEEVSNVLGGMSAWKAAGLPVETAGGG